MDVCYRQYWNGSSSGEGEGRGEQVREYGERHSSVKRDPRL